jgi:hypothetical protein
MCPRSTQHSPEVYSQESRILRSFWDVDSSAARNRRDSCANEDVTCVRLRRKMQEKTLASAGVVRDDAVIGKVKAVLRLTIRAGDMQIGSYYLRGQGAMRRPQLIELHEQPWFPLSLRHEITDALQFGLNRLKAYAPIAPLLQSSLQSTQCRSIVDMCSGSGGPWLDLSRRLQPDVQVFHILLTDKYPNLGALQMSE